MDKETAIEVLEDMQFMFQHNMDVVKQQIPAYMEVLDMAIEALKAPRQPIIVHPRSYPKKEAIAHLERTIESMMPAEETSDYNKGFIDGLNFCINDLENRPER